MDMNMTLAEWAKFNKLSAAELERAIFSAAAVLGKERLNESGTPQKTYQFDDNGDIIMLTFHRREDK